MKGFIRSVSNRPYNFELINSYMLVKEFFNKVAKELGYELCFTSNTLHDYIKHKLVVGKLHSKSIFDIFNKNYSDDPIYFLVTNKIIVREVFCTVVLSIQVEILNKEFCEDDSPIVVLRDNKEYSFRMKDENHMEDYDFDDFLRHVKDKIKKMNDDAFEQIKKVSYVELDSF